MLDLSTQTPMDPKTRTKEGRRITELAGSLPIAQACARLVLLIFRLPYECVVGTSDSGPAGGLEPGVLSNRSSLIAQRLLTRPVIRYTPANHDARAIVT